ncbi:MAG: hypothetical protein ABJA98_07195 [Acidobacteriota bacterium]
MSTDVAVVLDATQISAYRSDGYLVVRRVFSPDTIAALDAEANRRTSAPT